MSPPTTVCPKCVIASLIAQLSGDDLAARNRMAVHLVAFCDEALRTLMHMRFEPCSIHQTPAGPV
jgi:hypothetical protein